MKKLRSFTAGDPLASFLLTRLHLSPIRFSIFIIIVAFVYDILQFYLFGKLPRGVLDIFTISAWHYLFISSMGYFYLWSYNALPKLLDDLAKSNSIRLTSAEINSHMLVYRRSGLFFLSVAGGLVLGSLYLVRSTLFSSIYENPIFLAPRQVIWFISGYIVTRLASTLVINVIIINKVFRNKSVHLEPMHPDKAGGLGKLGDYSKVVAYLISFAGVVIGLTELRYFYGLFPQELWIIHISIPLYIVGATVSFFAPIFFVHQKMKEAKSGLLIEIQEKIAREYYNSRDKILHHSEDIVADIGRIKQLQTLYELTEKIPEWPFNTQAFHGYLVSVFSPLFSLLLGMVVDYIRGLVF